MKKKNFMGIVSTVAALLITVTAPVVQCSAAKGNGEDISPAIDWLRRNTKIEKSASRGSNVELNKSDFEKAVGADISYISLSSLPSPEDGRLCLNGVDVIEGQTIAISGLQYLVFAPTEKAKSAEFKVKCAVGGWTDVDIPCRISITDSKNGSPTLASVSTETMSGICCVASPRIYDPDGDTAVLSVVKYPQNGSVRISGNKVYYTPINGYTGTDTMIVVATDIYGNASPETELSFMVSKNTASIIFEDMKNDAAHAAAISLAEKSVVAFTQKDGKYYFSPAGSVSRIDFMVMLLSAAGVNTDTDLPVSLKFDDINNVNSAKLSYLKKAADMGIIGLGDKSFSPDGAITRMTAAEWVCKLLKPSVKQPPSFADMNGYTENERYYAAAVIGEGFMDINGSNFEPAKVMTKSDVAIVLKRVMDYLGGANN